MEIALHLRRRPGVPLYVALSEAIRAASESGQLPPGYKLPAARELAAAHCLSVSTVVRAYEQLKSQGFIETRAKAGAFLSSHHVQHPHAASDAGQAALRWSQYGQHLQPVASLDSEHSTALIYTPPVKALPLTAWQKMLIKHRVCYDDPSFRDYGSDPLGYRPLRQAVADYLSRGRGLRVTADNIVVTSYSRLDFFCRLLLDQGDHVAIEDPSYPAARAILKSHGAVLHPISVDAEGLVVDQLLSLNVPLKMVYLTPTHNDPTGAMLSLSRREQLVKFAHATSTLIWENDFDSHLRYTAPLLPSLFDLAGGQSVVFSTSFWMTLGPLVSLGFMAVPTGCLPVLKRALSLAHLDASALEASALADFIEAGVLEKQMHRNRVAYRSKRQSLLSALVAEFGSRLVWGKESCGFHLLLRFPREYSAAAIVECAAGAQLPLTSSTSYYLCESPDNEFLCPFMNLPDVGIESRVQEFGRRLKKTGSQLT